MGSLLNIVIGLILAVVVFVVLTALISFHDSRIVFGLVAVLVFLAVAAGDRLHLPRG